MKNGDFVKFTVPLSDEEGVLFQVLEMRGDQALVERWSNQTDSGQNKLTPSADRWKERARTYQGWADSMAEQWGIL